MKQNKTNLAVVGSGLSGAILANKLQASGYTVTVFDKSRGTGGRLSSCRTESAEGDLGAPYFDPQSTDFRNWLTDQASIQEWQPYAHQFQDSKLFRKSYFVASPRQSALTRTLLSECKLCTSTQVGYIWPEKNRVLIRNSQGESLGHFDRVVIATPALQAAKLLEAIPRFSKKARSINYESSWMVVVKIKVVEATPVDIISGDHPILSRCIKNCAKPGRLKTNGYETWVLEANSLWSKEHINADKELVASVLYSTFSKLVPGSHAEVCRVHRWLYSSHKSLNEGYLWDTSTNIGACGDWLSSGQLQGAWDSANLLANRLISEINPSTEMKRALIY